VGGDRGAPSGAWQGKEKGGDVRSCRENKTSERKVLAADRATAAELEEKRETPTTT